MYFMYVQKSTEYTVTNGKTTLWKFSGDRTSKELEVLGGVRITVSDPNPGRDGASK
jgi:hypothetical protein